MISLLVGIIVSPRAANWIKPLNYAFGSEEDLGKITLAFARLVLGVQLTIAGVTLPSRWLFFEWRSLALLLLPGMIGMFAFATLIIWGMVPGIGILHAMAIGAAVTPTDPVLSNVIVNGKFADKNVPKDLQRIIIGM